MAVIGSYFKVDLDGAGEVLSFKFILGHGRDYETFRHLAEWL